MFNKVNVGNIKTIFYLYLIIQMNFWNNIIPEKVLSPWLGLKWTPVSKIETGKRGVN